MTKKPHPGPEPKTHFDQIPVDVVKKIVRPDDVLEKAATRTDARTIKAAAGRRHADAGHFHGVQFYKDPDALCRIVGGFIGDGLGDGTLAIVIATPEHAARIETCLRSRGSDVEALKRSGDLVVFDARETLQLFMVDDMPNPGAFRRAMDEILTHAGRGREHCAIRAYGEMVDLLWKDGREAAAIRLETLWNQLGTTHDFELLCGYSMGNFYKGAAIDEIRRQHSHLVDTDGVAASLPVGL